ncbi:MAG: hypothetical protein K6G73_12535 [Marinilabiliaceae bacterium]|nr:hypothetical protein [Marinilabiliaceae bacterium]
MLTKKERKILRALCDKGTMHFYAKDMEVYQELETKGLIYYYYEYGRWNAEITSEGIKALSDVENKYEFVRGVIIVIAVIVVGLLLSSCTSTKEIDSNRLHTESHIDEHLARELLSEMKKQSQTRVDNITTRDSVKYTERNVDGNKICETEIIKWRDREVTVHDTIYIEKNDSTSVKDKSKDNTTDDNNQNTTIVEQPPLRQRIRDGMFWLIIVCALFLACRTLFKLRR